jgi:hypothetical protein
MHSVSFIWCSHISRAPLTIAYYYERESPNRQRKASPDERKYDIVYCKGTCKGNGNGVDAIAGVGVWWVPDDSR